jgi:hypothetical protein
MPGDLAITASLAKTEAGKNWAAIIAVTPAPTCFRKVRRESRGLFLALI